MSNSVKVALYALLALLAGISGYFALTNFGHLMAKSGERGSELEQIEPERKNSPESPLAESNGPASTPPKTDPSRTNQPNEASVTNGVSGVLTNTNGVADIAQRGTSTNTPKSDAKTPKKGSKGAQATASQHPGSGHIGLWTALFVVSLIGLGILMANDVSHYMGTRALKVLYNDEGEGLKNPEYEQAEQVWANGKHLEAIGLMREYLNKNPREQHVAIRIAEIYEKDLGNFLAAALEYEEVLKCKLAPERWGWAAIHLCNLYFKLGHEEKAFELLRRIVNEYPNTAAAEKARKRLEQVDGASFEQLPTETPVNSALPPAEKPGRAEPPSNLPPGFKPKK